MAGLTVAAVAGAGAVVMSRPDPEAPRPAEAAFLPGLSARLNDVARIELSSSGRTATVVRGPSGWTVLEKAGYPASADAVKSAVVGLAEARAVEPRTAQPEMHARLGVQDPAPGAPSLLVRLTGPGGGELAAAILGNAAPGTGQARYARRPGEAQSWLVRAALDLPGADPLRWADRSLPRLPRERVESVVIRQPDGGAVTVRRPDAAGAFVAEGLPAGAKAKESVVDETTGALGYLSFEDVAKADPAWFATAPVAIYHSTDGVVLTVRTAKREDGYWITLDAAAAERATPEAAAEAETWQARHAGWAYRVYDALGEDLARAPAGFADAP